MATQVQRHIAEAIDKDRKRGRRVARSYMERVLPNFDKDRLEEILDEHQRYGRTAA